MSGIRSFFEPKSIAVAGVSKDSDKLGSIIFANLIDNSKKGLLSAPVYALNPAYDRIGDQPCYPSIGELPEVPELLVVAVPQSKTVELIRAAGKHGVKASIIISGGYSEVGRVDVEKEIRKLAAKHGMRVLGPNTVGLVDTWSGVDSVFLRPMKTLPDGSQVVSLLKPLKGEVTIITQSGHLGVVVAELLAANGVGIRALVGTGNQLDVSIEDVIQYFADDPHTKVVAVYLEGLRDGRRFMNAAVEVVERKPLIVLKVGRTSVGGRAALTHTASLVGDYQVYRAALRQAGVIEADTLQEMVDYSISLLMLPRVAGRRIAIVTNAGGVGAIAADKAAELGLRVDPPGIEARGKLFSEIQDSAVVSNASLGNPIDLTASATTNEFNRVAKLVTALPEYDLALLIPSHQAPGIDYDIARRLGEVISKTEKPVVSCVIGDTELAGRIRREFMEGGIPSFPSPERAVRALAVTFEYSRSRQAVRGLGVVPTKSPRRFAHRKGPLPPKEVGHLLRSYGIGEPKSLVVRSSRDFARLHRFTYPAACKLLSKGLLHKTDVGGVVIDVPNGREAERVFGRFNTLAARKGLSFDGMLIQEMVPRGVELLLGGMHDSIFGPVVILGFGGAYAEVIRDYSLAVAPVTPLDVRRMLIGERLGLVLGGYRGGPRVNIDLLSRMVSSFSKIMVENPQIEQMEVNPLIATSHAILSVDARVLLR